MKRSHDVKKRGYLKGDESLSSGGKNPRMMQAVWVGKQCEGLGLIGSADAETFQRLEDGFLPTGERFKNAHGPGEEILRHDMVLRAPKSVAIYALEDPRLFDAHMDACKEAFVAVEERYSFYRKGKERRSALAGSLMGAIVPHWTNRDGEPFLHSHCAIFNGVKTPEGEWRAMKMTPINREMWVGSYYRNVLAAKVKELGYPIRVVPMNGGDCGFEIAFVSSDQVKHFSQRGEEIKKVKENLGISNRRAGDLTRKHKGVQLTWDDLRESIRQQREAIGMTIEAPLESVEIDSLDPTEAVNRAVAHLSERACRFDDAEIFRIVYQKLDAELCSLDDIRGAIAKHPELLDYGLIKDDPNLHGQFTTVGAVERETRTINAWFEGQGKANPILNREESLKKLSLLEAKVNEGQLETVLGLLGSSDRHQIFQGFSGVGKTRTLKPFKAIAESEGYRIQWFAPSFDAAKKLGDSVGAKAETLQKLVYTNHKIKHNDILVVDEAALASAEMGDLLVAKANKAGARILLVGDIGQNRPIDAGCPMRSLMDAGATTHHVVEILRQQDKIQRKAVTFASKGQSLDALNLLNQYGYVTEIPEADGRASEIANEYLSLSTEERAKTLIVAGTHVEKDRIVEKIRDGLKEEGVLGRSTSVVQLSNKGWTKEQCRDFRNYEAGDYVSVSKISNRCPLAKDEFYRVIGVGETLSVQSNSGKILSFNPAKYVEKSVFSAKEIEIAVGDEMRWQHTNHKKGRKNGETFKVVAVDDAFATIKTEKGKVQNLRLDTPIAADYTITSTSYRSQGSDRPRVFVAATDDRTSNREAFYVSVSRQIEEIKVWTSDLNKLRLRVALSNEHPNTLKDFRKNNSNDYANVEFREDNRSENDLSNRFTGSDFKNRGSTPADRGASWSDRASGVIGNSRAAQQASRGREQDTGSDWESSDRDGLYRGVGRTDSDGYGRPNQRNETSNSDPSRTQRDSTEHFEGIEGVCEDLLELAYQRKLSEALADPLARLTQSFADLHSSSQQNNKAQREHAIALAQSRVLSIAIEQWKEDPTGLRAEEYLSYAMASLESTVPEWHDETFWVPESGRKPEAFEDRHWQELTKSCIHPDLIELNAESSEGEGVLERLLATKLESLGSGQFVTSPQAKLMERYEGVAEGGWWARGGHDPADFDRVQEWGTFKPDKPREILGKTVKYESPLGTPRGLFIPHVSREIAEAIYKKFGVENPCDNFWETVVKKNLPIVVTEGAKKTWASLSQGYPTIGVSGVNGLYRTKDDTHQQLSVRELNPDFAAFATPGRQITIAFDEETKERSITNVRRDLVRTVEVLEAAGCVVKVARWDASDKGIDDLIASKGPASYDRAIAEASSPSIEMGEHYLLEYLKIEEWVRRCFPRESQEFIDTEVWLRANQRGDGNDGRRFVGAGAKFRGLDEDEYCKNLLEIGGQIRKDVMQANEPIEGMLREVLEDSGWQTKNGGMYFRGNQWSIYGKGADLSVRRLDGTLTYQTRLGVVTNNVDFEPLMAIYLENAKENSASTLRR